MRPQDDRGEGATSRRVAACRYGSGGDQGLLLINSVDGHLHVEGVLAKRQGEAPAHLVGRLRKKT